MPGRLLLAVDTATHLGTVAVAAEGEVLARAELGPQGTHAALLVPAIDEVLEDSGVNRDELQGIVLGAGPGSFTGVRVAAATAKGLAHALEIPIYPISSLAAAAAGIDTFGKATAGLVSEVRMAEPRYVLFDARSDRVYAACYLATPTGLHTLIPPHATTIGELLSDDVPLAVFAGDGAERHADEIRGAGFAVLPLPFGLPTADGLIRVFAGDDRVTPVTDLASWEPEYLRATGAERMSERAPGLPKPPGD